MPELPEVETIRAGLERRIDGRIICSFDVRLAKQFQSNPRLIERDIVGAKVKAIRRRGKLLIFDLSSGSSLLIHLKMTGQLIWQDKSGHRLAGGHPIPFVEGELPSTVTHIVIGFDDGSKVFFNDLRQFGYAKLEPTVKLSELPFIKSLGPEPLSSDFKLADFTARLRRRGKTPVKSAILDQSISAGVGNIYADESLFVAKVHPKRLVNSLSDKEVEQIFKAIKLILKEALKWGGSSIQAYIDPEGRRGTYLQHAWVYRREGKTCRVCNGKIVKTTVGGRGTHFCPHCQPLEHKLFATGDDQ